MGITFNVCFAAGMIAAPAAFTGLWCYWTGVRGMRRILLATGAVLAAFAGVTLVHAPERLQPYYFLWGLGGFWGLLFGLCIPFIRREFNDLPQVPAGASLKPRRVEMFFGAWIWPFVAWAALTGATLLADGDRPLFWLGPLLGLATLVMLPFLLRLSVLEAEPLGGPDPEALGRSYETFRRRRIRTMYWLLVALALGVTAGWRLLPGHAGWTGGVVGCGMGAWGAVFGTWADAQRYLLRLQLSGARPPA